MKTVIDLILLAIIAASIWAGYKKGLIMGIGGMIAIIISLYGACLLSTAFSYELVPAARPFASGYVERQMKTTVLEKLGLQDTELSLEDILASEEKIKEQFCYECFSSVGIYDDAARQMGREAEAYAAENGTDIEAAVVEVLCSRITFVAGIALCFLLLFIVLTALGNIPNLTFKIPNMDTLNDVGGAIMGLVKGMTLCVLLCWALRFTGLVIGMNTLEHTILARFFVKINFVKLGIGI